MNDRSLFYSDCIQEKGSPLLHGVGFIDCTNTYMCRCGGDFHKHSSCYRGRKLSQFLLYLTITKTNCLYFILGNDPELRRRHDMTLYRHIGLDVILNEGLHLNGKHYLIYGDLAFDMRPWLQVGSCGVFRLFFLSVK